MRLPWGQLESFFSKCRGTTKVSLLGCLSFEDRCLEVPKLLSQTSFELATPHFFEIHDPKDAFPDYSKEIHKRIERNWSQLIGAGIQATRRKCDLLATEDEVLDMLGEWEEWKSAEIVVLDISSFPKRYFCLLLKRLLNEKDVKKLVVTYTQAGERGYPAARLCDDPMPCDFLPGFGVRHPLSSEWLVVSVGFEALNVSSLVLPYWETTRTVKFVLTFPPSVHTNQRQWATLLDIAGSTRNDHLSGGDVEIVSLWDAERVYLRLQNWSNDRKAKELVRSRSKQIDSISLAPFGAKPHTLAMALFAIKYGCGMYYTQPKSYSPDYAVGAGNAWYYIVKWDGVACFDRPVVRP